MRLQPEAPYNRTAVGRIRELAAKRYTPEEIARDLNWDAERVRRIAARHEISFKAAREADETVEQPRSVKPLSAAQAKQAQPMIHESRERFGRRSDHPRNRYLSISLSVAATAALETLSRGVSKKSSGVAGVTLDYILRSGKFAQAFKDALEERGGA